MQEEISVTTLAERVHQYHAAVLTGQKEIKADIDEVKADVKEVSEKVSGQGERIAKAEERQGLLTKIILASIGVSGVTGTAIGLGSKVAGLW